MCMQLYGQFPKEQEYIPVGCVSSAAVAVPGGSPPAPPPQEQTPPGRRHPSPLLTESQTPVKTLPCPNFVAGGKHIIFYVQ